MIISTEKVFDILPFAVDMVEKLDMKGYILKNKEILDAKDKDAVGEVAEGKGFDFVMHILKNIGKIKTEVFETLAVVHDKSADEIKAQPFRVTAMQLKELLQDKELMGFFKSAM